MNWINHFLGSYIGIHLYLLLFQPQLILPMHIPFVFAIFFGVLLDLDFLSIRTFTAKKNATRTFLQEPVGLLLVAIPLGLLFSNLFGTVYFWLTIIPYALHILLDYMVIHTVYPYAPFSKKPFSTGFILSVFPTSKNIRKFDTLNENYVMVILLSILFLLM